MSVDSDCHTNVSWSEEESPAVPRPRLHIRILMMVDQIAVKNDYEWEALELLLTVLKCHFHPSTILNNKGKLHALLTYLYH